ncbi:integrase, catalytic region, zinc finger, CCHC-type containing protein, partial [Tanacetum coccineum]
MNKVGASQVTNTNKAKSVLSSTGLSATSSVRRPSNRNSSFKNSVISNTKNSLEKVEVSDRADKKPDVASKNVALNKIVTKDEIKNALIAKNILCVTCAKNMLISCHDNCLAKYKLNVHSNVRRALFTTPRIVKSTFKDTTLVVSKTRFSVRTVQSKSLDTTLVVSKAKIVTDTSLSAKKKVSVVQIVLWIVDSGCSKHMTGDRSLLKNFVEKFMGTVHFGKDHFAAIIGYGNYVQGNIMICHVYYVEGLGHNLFIVGQFCDGDLGIAFRSTTCFVQNLKGDDLLTGDCKSNLYTISIPDMDVSSAVCLMSKASSTNSWLWHRRLSHLNFGSINNLTKHDLVDGFLKFKYGKDHLCSACEQGKSKKSSHPPKVVSSTHFELELLHMDLCGPIRVASINGKKYILVIVDDYSRFTWLNFNAKVCKIRTDNGTEFKIATLKAHYDKLVLGLKDFMMILKLLLLRKTFEIKEKELLIENDHLLELIISQDLVHTAVNTLAAIADYQKIEQSYVDEYNECLELKTECISLEIKVQKYKESFQNNQPQNKQDAPEFPAFFEINELKAQLKAKDNSISKLRDHIYTLKCKKVSEGDKSVNNSKVISPGMYKLDLKPLSPMLRSNREAHKLLVYVRDTCPSSIRQSEKLIAVTPINKVKKVRFTEPSTSSSNTHKQADFCKTKDSNKPLLPSTGVINSTSASRSKPLGNLKKNRISRPTSSNKKNNVEDHLRSVKPSLNKKNHVSEPVCNANIKHSVLNANSELICATCNECMFDAIHDLYVLDYVNNVNVRAQPKSIKSKKKKMWKATGIIYTNVGYSWKPTGRTFTIDGNTCPLTRITSTTVVPPKKPISTTVVKKTAPSSNTSGKLKDITNI